MKKTLRIARIELSTLFFSPIAWFLLIVLMVQVALNYTTSMEWMEQSKQLYGSSGALTGQIFAGPPGGYGVLSGILSKLYLYIPLITMGLMSREISSGTIKLLYSSPIKVREIIYGKFVAMMVYNLLLIGVLLLFVIAGIITVPHFDYGLVLSGLLGIYLLLCAYSAIGLFMSCLTAYQVVAAISTFVIFAFLSYIGTMWQEIDFVRDLTYSLAMTGRAEKMIAGLITTKDLAYFGVIIYLFLGLSILKLRSGRESRPILVRIGQYTFIVVSAILAGYLTSRPGFIGYCDATATKSNTLTGNTQEIIKGMGEDPIEVTTYVNFLDRTYGYDQPSQRNSDMDRWESYIRFKSNIKFKYVYYYDSVMTEPNFYKWMKGKTNKQIVEMRTKAYKTDMSKLMTPEEIRKIIDLRPEENRLVMQLKYKDRSTFLRVFNDMEFWPGETEVDAAFKRMTVKLPKIAFLDGGFERSIYKAGDREYKTLTNQKSFRYALINQGFDVDTVNAEDRDIPTDIAALVIGDPKTNFSLQALARIQQYMDGGGNLLIAGEPGKQAVLNPLLKGLGVQLMDGAIVQRSRDYSPNLVLPYLTATGAGLSKKLDNDFQDSVRMSMPTAAGLTYGSSGAYTIRPLLMTDEKVSWNKKRAFVMDSAEVAYSPAEGDEKKAIPTALALTRKVGGREQRIVVTGDADFLSNSELGRNNVRADNFHFNTALFGWFANGEFPIETTRRKSKDNHLILNALGVNVLKALFLGILPGLLLIGGAVFLIRRKRK
ncbi:MAG TPA: Gldg family protein [Puia sp.]